MDSYSYISENGIVREIADLQARNTIATYDERITEALTAAQNAETKATTAQATATTANTRATSAQTTANTANSKAQQALDNISGLVDYSTSEKQVGKWTDNTNIYKRTFNLSYQSNWTSISVAMKKLIKVEWIATYNSYNYVSSSSSTNYVQIRHTGTGNPQYSCSTSGVSNITVTLWYLKN